MYFENKQSTIWLFFNLIYLEELTLSDNIFFCFPTPLRIQTRDDEHRKKLSTKIKRKNRLLFAICINMDF